MNIQKNTAQIISNSGLRDNHRHGKVAAFFEDKTKANSHIAIVTAYFTVAAYMRLKPVLARGEKIRLLFGDPAFIAGFETVAQNAVFSINDDALALLSKLDQRASVADCIEWFTNDVEVRSVIEPGFLHGKMAHISTPDAAHAIVGSSNFTVRGLGLAQYSNNVELNLIAHDSRDCDALLGWFDELWNDKTKVQDVREQVVAYLKQYFKDQTPEFIYQKTLFHVFGDQDNGNPVDENRLKQSGVYQSPIWHALFDFQKQGVYAAIHRLEKYNGCILADSVGLGKTYTALGVIRYFQRSTRRILVLCPKKLQHNWTTFTQYLDDNPFKDDLFEYDVLFHTDLGRGGKSWDAKTLSTIPWNKYDLVVIDESHNLRNNRINELADEDASQTRYQFLMNKILAGGKTKVLLLSATPVNNSLIDLRNQISFIAGGDVSSHATLDAELGLKLGIRSINTIIKKAQKHFIDWTKLSQSSRSKLALSNLLGGDFLTVLDKLTIARSRSQIKQHFAHEMEKLGGFPKRLPPVSHYVTQIDTHDQFPNFDAINKALDAVTLPMFRPFAYLADNVPAQDLERYAALRAKGLSQDTRERTLVAIMKVLLLKRLESSIHSFTGTLGRMIENIDALLKRLDAHDELIGGVGTDWQLNELDEDNTELREALEVGKKLKYQLIHIDKPKWRTDLLADRVKLEKIYQDARMVNADRDTKLIQLKQLLVQKLQHPTARKDGQTNRKTLVFTAFSDTAEYLYKHLQGELLSRHNTHSGLIVGSAGAQTLTPSRNTFNDILADFAPVSKQRSGSIQGQLDILIATDCISEGQNLQDCDTVINYDIHWNPVRIIQRFGRVDRIGSQATNVHMINFWPTDQLDQYIGLKKRVETRMALSDMTATGTDNLLNPEQLQDLVDGELSLREQQLLRLDTELIDLDEDPNQITLADLSLNEFRQDLHQFLDAQRKALAEAPLGLFAVVPSDPQIAAAQAGVLFCLRQKNTPTRKNGHASAQSNDSDAALNPLHDYYLAYVRSDGTVQLGHAQAKAVLNLWRTLSAGKTEAYETVCRAFDLATQGGKDMSAVSTLLQAATAHIKQAVQGTATVQLTLNRDFKLPAKLEQNLAENAFELVTWLVIRGA
jgi:ERCC4-related helicase